MDAKERREQIQEILVAAREPVSAAALARRFSVSRQVIVGDVALLRASGADISSTARGYICQIDTSAAKDFPYVGIVACKHGWEDLLSELYCVVDYGGCLIDVMIEHPYYGQLCGNLEIHSRFDADQFAAKIREGNSEPLSALTGGIHLHRIGCKDEPSFQRICQVLSQKGILLE